MQIRDLNLNIAETVLVFLGLQFAGYSTSRTIDELPIRSNYRLIILWCITVVMLIPIAFIKGRKNKMNERQINQMATKIASEVSKKMNELNDISKDYEMHALLPKKGTTGEI
jgi:hypothetical protein